MTAPGQPNVLFVTEKWTDCNPEEELSSVHHNFIAALNATGLAEISTCFFDETAVQTGRHVDETLGQICQDEKPDMIVLKMVRGTDLNPAPEVLQLIRDRFGTKIVSIYGDTFDDFAIHWMEEYASSVDVSIVQDCYSNYPNKVAAPENYMDTWTPQDPSVFRGNDGDRPIDVSFVGRVQRYTSRKLYLSLLQEAGIEVMIAGGVSEADLPIADYAEIMRQSKITLNFSQPVFDEPNFQCKGRTVEATLCGALLIEDQNPETVKWFTPGQDYVDFSDERDLVTKVRYYLENDEDRRRIAAAGHRRATENYCAEKYWRLVFNRVWPTAFGPESR